MQTLFDLTFDEDEPIEMRFEKAADVVKNSFNSAVETVRQILTKRNRYVDDDDEEDSEPMKKKRTPPIKLEEEIEEIQTPLKRKDSDATTEPMSSNEQEDQMNEADEEMNEEQEETNEEQEETKEEQSESESDEEEEEQSESESDDKESIPATPQKPILESIPETPTKQTERIIIPETPMYEPITPMAVTPLIPITSNELHVRNLTPVFQQMKEDEQAETIPIATETIEKKPKKKPVKFQTPPKVRKSKRDKSETDRFTYETKAVNARKPVVQKKTKSTKKPGKKTR